MTPNRNMDWPLAWAAVEEIARSEGCRLKAYRCPAGVPTIGWGRTRDVRLGDEIVQAQADRWFVDDLRDFADAVRKLVTRPATANEFGAMVSLAYNVGKAGFAKSTVLRKHNEGDAQAAARAFALWNKSRGQVMPGLTARRAREAALYLAPDDDTALPMPQEIEPESSLSVSPIAVSGAATALAGALAGLTGMTEQGAAVAAVLGVNPAVGFAVVALWSGITTLHNRMKQRKGGWA